MNYKDYPIEIKDKIKLRVEEQGNVYNEILFIDRRTRGKNIDGFDWDKTPEGHGFWYGVISDEMFDIFYAAYPKDISFSLPFRNGDIVKCIKNTFNHNKKPIGKLFKLDKRNADHLNKGGIAIPDSYPSGETNEYRVNFTADCFIIVGRAGQFLEESITNNNNKKGFKNDTSTIIQESSNDDTRTDCSIKGTVCSKQNRAQVRCGY